MYQKLNLLESDKSVKRNIKLRTGNKEEYRDKALKFEKDYFDGDRNTGYGGYYYDGRWVKIAKKLIDIFDLKRGSKFLDVGCAKGFLLYDLHKENKEIANDSLKNNQSSNKCYKISLTIFSLFFS